MTYCARDEIGNLVHLDVKSGVNNDDNLDVLPAACLYCITITPCRLSVF